MFCIHCGAEIYEKARFCPQCGKPVADIPTVSDSEITEENTAEETAVIPDVSAEGEGKEENTVLTESDEKATEEITDTPAEEFQEKSSVQEASEEPPACEKSEAAAETVTEKAEIVMPPSETSKPEKKRKKHPLAKANAKAVIGYAAAIAAVSFAGFGCTSQLSDTVINAFAENTYKSGNMQDAYTFYKGQGGTSKPEDIMLETAKNALEQGNYPLAEAYFACLENNDNYETEENLPELLDESFSARCRQLMSAGHYTLAMVCGTQISDPVLSRSIANDAYISQAKIFSADGKNLAAYNTAMNVNTAVGYDVESYEIILYNYAAELYNSMDFAGARKVLAESTSAESVELRNASCHYMAEDLFEQGKYAEAASLFDEAGDYMDSKQKSGQCWYKAGVEAYDSKDYANAKLYFENADGYNSSEVYLEKIAYEEVYGGWSVTAEVTDKVTFFTHSYKPVESIPKDGDFIIVFTINGVQGKTTDITVTLTSPSESVITEYLTDVTDGYHDYLSYSYEFPDEGDTGIASFTFSFTETGEVIAEFPFEITE